MTIARTIKIKGKVQGVNFRYYTQSEARVLGIAGTVENLDDGCVLVRAEGEEEQVKALIKWCQKGPLLARVEGIEVEEVAITGFKNFLILR